MQDNAGLGVRKIPASVLSLPRFADRVRIHSHTTRSFRIGILRGLLDTKSKTKVFTGLRASGRSISMSDVDVTEYAEGIVISILALPPRS